MCYAGATGYYLYDGCNAVCELDSSGNLVNTNLYATDGLATSRTSGGTTTCYLFDHQGNTSETVVGSTIAFHFAYNAWGQCNYASPTSEEGPPYLTHAYNARWGYLADETGLYYCQNRYYDPVTGRFLTRDPIGYEGGANLYGYCGGNPVLNADPWGQKAVSFEDISNFFAGWGDNLTFGGTKWARRAIGEWSGIGDANEAVDYDSGWYTGGQVTGSVHGIGLGWKGIVGLGSTIRGLRGSATLAEAGVAVAQGERAAPAAFGIAQDITAAKEGCYLVQFEKGLYIGQSKHVWLRLLQHVARGRCTLEQARNAEFIAVEGGVLARRIREATLVNQLGGVDEVANLINPVAEKYWQLYNIPRP